MSEYNYCRIVQDDDARRLMKEGVDILANLVKSTLGPNGRTVAMEQNDTTPVITQDGVSVARSIKLGNPVKNMGAQLVKGVANKAQADSGDGTTSATVIAQAILSELAVIEKSENVTVIKQGMRKAVEDIVEQLQLISVPITNSKEDMSKIRNIAMVSSNGDIEVTDAVVEAIKNVGQKGAIRIDVGKTNQTIVKNVSGMTYQNGLMSPYMAQKKETQSVSYEKAMIFVTDHNLKSLLPLTNILTYCDEKKLPLVIIADAIDNDAMFYLLKNIQAYGANIAAVKAPGFGSQQSSNLEDIAIMCGATPILQSQYPEIGEILEMETEDILGTSDFTGSMHQFSLENGDGKEDAIEAQKSLVKAQIDEEEDGFMKEKLEERLAKMTNGVSVIYAGANSETEAEEKRDRIDDAVNAVKAAVAEGIVAGGGTPLLKISYMLEETKSKMYDGDYGRGYNAVLSSVRSTFRQILVNADKDPDVIADRVLTESDNMDFGYDVKSGDYCNLLEKGIIDPLLVVKNSLVNAESVASTVVSTSGVVYYVNDKMEEDV